MTVYGRTLALGGSPVLAGLRAQRAGAVVGLVARAGLRAQRAAALPCWGASGGSSGGGGDPVPVPVALPAAWLLVALPANGYIGPVMGQLALLRGAAAVYSAGGLLIGGARLVGPAGKVFVFSSAGSAAMWAAINKARGLREVELMAAFDAGPAAVYRAKKAAALVKIAGAVVNAAGRCTVPAIAAALVAESSFCLSKWA